MAFRQGAVHAGGTMAKEVCHGNRAGRRRLVLRVPSALAAVTEADVRSAAPACLKQAGATFATAQCVAPDPPTATIV